MSIFRHAAVAISPLLIQATGLQDLAALDRLVAAELGNAAGSPGGALAPIDRRLRLRACAEPVAVDPAVGGAVGLRCVSPAWRIRVPIAAPGAEAEPAAAARPTAGPRASAPLITAGQQVTAIVRSAGFTVTTSVTALERGVVGQRIRLRGADRNAGFVGTVLADGRVQIAGLN